MTRLTLVCVIVGLSLAAADQAFSQSEPRATAPSEPRPAKKTEPRPAKPTAKKPASGGSGPPSGATLAGTFGDWSAYTATTGRSKICFAQSEPQSRSPATLKDTKAYLFVSFRPADNVRNEVAAVLNFKTKENGPASLAMGPTTYDLVTKGENAWVKAPSDEALAIGTMSKGGTMTIQATSAKGNKTTDRYSLAGFTQALERAKRDCP